MSMLKIQGMTMRFGGIVAVDHLDLEVKQGELVSLIGPNGAGKTTVFNVLTGLYRAAGGEIWFEGESISDRTPQEIVKAGIARTFQNLRLFKNMRVIENVLMGNHIKTTYNPLDLLARNRRFHQAESQAAQNALDILSSIGLADKIDRYANSLPYGDQRRLEIARAIATGAKLLLLDEPAAGMNASETEALMRFIMELREKGFTILMIEHDMNLVMNISDRIYVLDFGKLIAHGLPKDITEDPRVIEAYLGSDADDDAGD